MLQAGDINDITCITESTRFVSACYRQPTANDIFVTRQSLGQRMLTSIAKQ